MVLPVGFRNTMVLEDSTESKLNDGTYINGLNPQAFAFCGNFRFPCPRYRSGHLTRSLRLSPFAQMLRSSRTCKTLYVKNYTRTVEI